MNERIKQLADKIWAEEYWDNPNTDKLLPAQLNKFAELIVRECCNVLQTHDIKMDLLYGAYGYDQGSLHKKIKQHFGVE